MHLIFFLPPLPRVQIKFQVWEQCRTRSGNGHRWSFVDSLLFFPCQINPEAVRGDFSSPEAETKNLRAQLNDSLKELHQKELRIQQLNSKVPAVLPACRVWAEGCGEVGSLQWGSWRRNRALYSCGHSPKVHRVSNG